MRGSHPYGDSTGAGRSTARKRVVQRVSVSTRESRPTTSSEDRPPRARKSQSVSEMTTNMRRRLHLDSPTGGVASSSALSSSSFSSLSHHSDGHRHHLTESPSLFDQAALPSDPSRLTSEFHVFNDDLVVSEDQLSPSLPASVMKSFTSHPTRILSAGPRRSSGAGSPKSLASCGSSSQSSMQIPSQFADFPVCAEMDSILNRGCDSDDSEGSGLSTTETEESEERDWASRGDGLGSPCDDDALLPSQKDSSDLMTEEKQSTVMHTADIEKSVPHSLCSVGKKVQSPPPLPPEDDFHLPKSQSQSQESVDEHEEDSDPVSPPRERTKSDDTSSTVLSAVSTPESTDRSSSKSQIVSAQQPKCSLMLASERVVPPPKRRLRKDHHCGRTTGVRRKKPKEPSLLTRSIKDVLRTPNSVKPRIQGPKKTPKSTRGRGRAVKKGPMNGIRRHNNGAHLGNRKDKAKSHCRMSYPPLSGKKGLKEHSIKEEEREQSESETLESNSLLKTDIVQKGPPTPDRTKRKRDPSHSELDSPQISEARLPSEGYSKCLERMSAIRAVHESVCDCFIYPNVQNLSALAVSKSGKYIAAGGQKTSLLLEVKPVRQRRSVSTTGDHSNTSEDDDDDDDEDDVEHLTSLGEEGFITAAKHSTVQPKQFKLRKVKYFGKRKFGWRFGVFEPTDHRKFLFVSFDNETKVIDWEKGGGKKYALVNEMENSAKVNAIAYVPCSPDLFVCAGDDGACQKYDLRTDLSKSVACYRVGQDRVSDICFSSSTSSSLFAACYASGKIRLWDDRFSKPRLDFYAHNRTESVVCHWHPWRRDILASGSALDPMVKIWDLSSQVRRIEQSDHFGSLSSRYHGGYPDSPSQPTSFFGGRAKSASFGAGGTCGFYGNATTPSASFSGATLDQILGSPVRTGSLSSISPALSPHLDLQSKPPLTSRELNVSQAVSWLRWVPSVAPHSLSSLQLALINKDFNEPRIEIRDINCKYSRISSLGNGKIFGIGKQPSCFEVFVPQSRPESCLVATCSGDKVVLFDYSLGDTPRLQLTGTALDFCPFDCGSELMFCRIEKLTEEKHRACLTQKTAAEIYEEESLWFDVGQRVTQKSDDVTPTSIDSPPLKSPVSIEPRMVEHMDIRDLAMSSMSRQSSDASLPSTNRESDSLKTVDILAGSNRVNTLFSSCDPTCEMTHMFDFCTETYDKKAVKVTSDATLPSDYSTASKKAGHSHSDYHNNPEQSQSSLAADPSVGLPTNSALKLAPVSGTQKRQSSRLTPVSVRWGARSVYHYVARHYFSMKLDDWLDPISEDENSSSLSKKQSSSASSVASSASRRALSASSSTNGLSRAGRVRSDGSLGCIARNVRLLTEPLRSLLSAMKACEHYQRICEKAHDLEAVRLWILVKSSVKAAHQMIHDDFVEDDYELHHSNVSDLDSLSICGSLTASPAKSSSIVADGHLMDQLGVDEDVPPLPAAAAAACGRKQRGYHDSWMVVNRDDKPSSVSGTAVISHAPQPAAMKPSASSNSGTLTDEDWAGLSSSESGGLSSSMPSMEPAVFQSSGKVSSNVVENHTGKSTTRRSFIAPPVGWTSIDDELLFAAEEEYARVSEVRQYQSRVIAGGAFYRGTLAKDKRDMSGLNGGSVAPELSDNSDTVSNTDELSFLMKREGSQSDTQMNDGSFVPREWTDEQDWYLVDLMKTIYNCIIDTNESGDKNVTVVCLLLTFLRLSFHDFHSRLFAMFEDGWVAECVLDCADFLSRQQLMQQSVVLCQSAQVILNEVVRTPHSQWAARMIDKHFTPVAMDNIANLQIRCVNCLHFKGTRSCLDRCLGKGDSQPGVFPLCPVCDRPVNSLPLSQSSKLTMRGMALPNTSNGSVRTDSGHAYETGVAMLSLGDPLATPMVSTATSESVSLPLFSEKSRSVLAIWCHSCGHGAHFSCASDRLDSSIDRSGQPQRSERRAGGMSGTRCFTCLNHRCTHDCSPVFYRLPDSHVECFVSDNY